MLALATCGIVSFPPNLVPEVSRILAFSEGIQSAQELALHLLAAHLLAAQVLAAWGPTHLCMLVEACQALLLPCLLLRLLLLPLLVPQDGLSCLLVAHLQPPRAGA